MVEKYFGCEIGCLNHISHMLYYPPKKDDDEEDNVIYFTVKTENYFDRFFLPFSLDPRDWVYDIKNYCRFNILNRIPITIKYLFSSSYIRKEGILDCFDFQNKDLPSMKEFLSLLTEKEKEENKDTIICLSNDKWMIRFTIGKLDEDMPYWLGWEIQFLPKNIFGRIKYSLKYIFGEHANQQGFEINEEIAKKIKGMITAVEKLNA